MALRDTDPESLKLIIELQLEESTSSIKGKHSEGEIPDAELAKMLHKAELESQLGILADRQMCLSIARAVELDGNFIKEHKELENQAASDRQHALGQPASGQDQTADDPSAVDDELLMKMKALYMDRPESVSTAAFETDICTAEAGTSSGTSSVKGESSSASPEIRTCVACNEAKPFFHVSRCPCSHEYCRDCLTDLFKTSTTDESLFPPRCCKEPIPLGVNQIFLPSGVVANFRAKAVEYSIPNRTYCHENTCSAFIHPDDFQGDVATCPQCQSTTCNICRGAGHEGDCPEDEATQEMIRFAAEQGWQRCQQCHRMVELDYGCNHISELFSCNRIHETAVLTRS